MQLAFLILGALLVLSGLALLFLKQDQSGTTKISVFGHQLDISQPALVLVVLGCAVFSLPVFVPVSRELPIPWLDVSSAAGSPRAGVWTHTNSDTIEEVASRFDNVVVRLKSIRRIGKTVTAEFSLRNVGSSSRSVSVYPGSMQLLDTSSAETYLPVNYTGHVTNITLGPQKEHVFTVTYHFEHGASGIITLHHDVASSPFVVELTDG